MVGPVKSRSPAEGNERRKKRVGGRRERKEGRERERKKEEREERRKKRSFWVVRVFET